MADRSLLAVEICGPAGRAYQRNAYRGGCGSDCHSLAVCCGDLRQEARGQMEVVCLDLRAQSCALAFDCGTRILRVIHGRTPVPPFKPTGHLRH